MRSLIHREWRGNRALILGVPAGALLGAMVVTAVMRLRGVALPDFPSWLPMVAFIILGYTIGSQVTPETIETIRRSILPIGIVVVGIIVAGFGLAFVLRAVGVDSATSILASSPGAFSQMAALSVQVGADAPLVATVHLLRVVVVILITPFIARILSG